MRNKQAIYTIRELASEFDVTSRTIRFYEEGGLIQPQRDGQTRIYTDQDRVKLKLILRGKRLGFSLAESRELIKMYDPSSDNTHQLLALRDKIHNRREALQQQLVDIQDMQNELDAAEERCQEALDNKNKTQKSSFTPDAVIR